MLNFLVKFLLLAIILSSGTLYFAQWKLEENLKSFARKVEPFMEFAYESASLNFNGEITLKNISILVPSVGANADVGELKFFIGNLYQLTTLNSRLEEKQLPEKAHISLKNVLIPLDNKLLSSSNELPIKVSDLLETAFCGEAERFGYREYAAMGYSYLSFSSTSFYTLDQYSGSLIINGTTEIENASKIDYQINIGGVLRWIEALNNNAYELAADTSNFISPELSLLEVTVSDQGYNLTKAEYCMRQQQDNKTDYYSGHMEVLEKQLELANIKLPDEFKAHYLASIQPGSVVSYLLKPQVNFKFEDLKLYDYSQLIESTGMRVTVNNKPVKLAVEGLSFKDLGKITALAKSKKKAKATPKESYRLVSIEYAYQNKALSEAVEFVDFKVKVTRDDGRLYQGKLTKTSNEKIWVAVHSKDGSVTYPISRNRVSEFQVYMPSPQS